MLDTIILMLPMGTYWVVDYRKFKTTEMTMRNFKAGFYKFVNNPTAEDKKNDIYKPCLTILRQGAKLNLQIQFSAPKIVYKNNIDELEESDIDEVVRILIIKLSEMGIKVFTKDIMNARVKSFHPSKNIPIMGGYTSSYAIKELAKIDISKRFDISKFRYKNNGESMQFYTNSHAIVLYDKIADLKKPKNRAIDQDKTIYQSSIYDYLINKQPHLEILRLEIRLSKDKKMNEILEKNGFQPNPLFKDIFKKNVCQKIVGYYWTEYFKNDFNLLSLSSNPQTMLQTIINKYRPIKVKKAIYLTGLIALCKDDEGIRGLRTTLQSCMPNMSWESIKNDIDDFKGQIESENLQNYLGFINDINKNISEFNAYKLNK